MHHECKNLKVISFNIYVSPISTCRHVTLFLALQEFIFQQIMSLEHNTSDYNEALLSSY